MGEQISCQYKVSVKGNKNVDQNGIQNYLAHQHCAELQLLNWYPFLNCTILFSFVVFNALTIQRGIVDDTNKYGCTVINLCHLLCHGMVSYLVFCTWSTTRNLCGLLASVGLAQVCPNYRYYFTSLPVYARTTHVWNIQECYIRAEYSSLHGLINKWILSPNTQQIHNRAWNKSWP